MTEKFLIRSPERTPRGDRSAPPTVLTVGESMALLDCHDAGRPRYGSSVSLRMAGAESNVAIGLARLGVPSRWLSRVGDDVLGDLIVTAAAGEGVDTRSVARDPSRPTGIFMRWRDGDHGHAEREYFRRGSAASALGPDDLHPGLLDGVGWLHLTGITLGLSASCAALVEALAARAVERGIPVSFDLNYRAAVWESPSAAADAARRILPMARWVLCGAEEGEALFGEDDPRRLGELLRGATGASGGDGGAAGSAGATDGDRGGAVVRVGVDGAWLIDGEAQLVPIDALEAEVLDEVGAGDAFAAGFIAGMLGDRGRSGAVRLAHTLAARALRGTGDWETLPTHDELAREGVRT